MIIIALGSNLPNSFGSSPKILSHSLISLETDYDVKVIAKSRLWRTSPVPKSDQPDYYNAAALLDTMISADELLKALQEIEKKFERVRDANRNQARTLDLDIIAFNDEVIDSDHLKIPHPRMQDRRFVLAPLADIAVNWVHPLLKTNVQTLLDAQSNSNDTAEPLEQPW